MRRPLFCAKVAGNSGHLRSRGGGPRIHHGGQERTTPRPIVPPPRVIRNTANKIPGSGEKQRGTCLSHGSCRRKTHQIPSTSALWQQNSRTKMIPRHATGVANKYSVVAKQERALGRNCKMTEQRLNMTPARSFGVSSGRRPPISAESGHTCCQNLALNRTDVARFSPNICQMLASVTEISARRPKLTPKVLAGVMLNPCPVILQFLSVPSCKEQASEHLSSI